MISEKPHRPLLSGRLLPALWVVPVLSVTGAGFFHGTARLGFIALAILAVFLGKGLFLLNAWDIVVLQCFGAYVGTVRPPAGPSGCWFWTNPFYGKKKLGAGGFITIPKLKVNDGEGTPIVIEANLWFRLEDAAQAIFAIDDYYGFVRRQSEAGLRLLAMKLPYDAHEPGRRSLRADTALAAKELQAHIQDHLLGTGIRITDARIVHLAYAPEVAGLMLARQQADAVVAAREQAVGGAVGAVALTLGRLGAVCGAAKRAETALGMLVTLCSRKDALPIIGVDGLP